MTLQEFKAWFEGFTESWGAKPPSIKQWARIKERIGEIDGSVTTERIFVDRYWQYYHPYWNNNPIWTGTGGTTCNAVGNTSSVTTNLASFTPTNAMYALGQADNAAV